jgi:hypothetical protein
MFSEEQEKLRLEKEAREKGTQIYRKVIPTVHTTETSYQESEAAPSEEKGLLTSAKEAIVSAVTGGIDTVKELIHDVKEAFEPEEGEALERQNPESPITKEPILKGVPFVSNLTIRR